MLAMHGEQDGVPDFATDTKPCTMRNIGADLMVQAMAIKRKGQCQTHNRMKVQSLTRKARKANQISWQQSAHSISRQIRWPFPTARFKRN
jgi:methionyl-tRNA formyltransferase